MIEKKFCNEWFTTKKVMEKVSFEARSILIDTINLLNENTNLDYFLVCEFKEIDEKQEIKITWQDQLEQQQTFKFNYDCEKIINYVKLYAIDSYDYATLLYPEEY